MTLPSKQDDGNVREQPLCARLWSACVVAYVENGYKWWFCGVVLSDVRTPLRTMSLALSFDLGTALSRSTAPYSSSHQTHSPLNSSRDSGTCGWQSSWVQHLGLVLNLVEALAVICLLAVNVGHDSSVVLPRSLVSLVSDVSLVSVSRELLRFICGQLLLRCQVALFPTRSLLTPSGTCLSISPIQTSTSLNDSLSATS